MSETTRIGEDGREWVECETCQTWTPRYYVETHAEIHATPPAPSLEFSKPFRFGPEMPPGSVGGCCGIPTGCTISSRGCLHKVEKRAWQESVGSPRAALAEPSGVADQPQPTAKCDCENCDAGRPHEFGRKAAPIGEPTTQTLAEVLAPQSIVPGLVERIQWATKQIDAALADTRVEGAAASWLRTIREGLVNASGDVPQYPICEHGEGSSHCIEWPEHIFCPGPVAPRYQPQPTERSKFVQDAIAGLTSCVAFYVTGPLGPVVDEKP